MKVKKLLQEMKDYEKIKESWFVRFPTMFTIRSTKKIAMSSHRPNRSSIGSLYYLDLLVSSSRTISKVWKKCSPF